MYEQDDAGIDVHVIKVVHESVWWNSVFLCNQQVRLTFCFLKRQTFILIHSNHIKMSLLVINPKTIHSKKTSKY